MKVNEETEKMHRREVVEAAIRYYEVKNKINNKQFIPGDPIPYAGRVFDEREITHLIEATLDFWLTAGRFANKFEKEFAEFIGAKYCLLTNSGSSANLLAFMANHPRQVFAKILF